MKPILSTITILFSFSVFANGEVGICKIESVGSSTACIQGAESCSGGDDFYGPEKCWCKFGKYKIDGHVLLLKDETVVKKYPAGQEAKAKAAAEKLEKGGVCVLIE